MRACVYSMRPSSALVDLEDYERFREPFRHSRKSRLSDSDLRFGAIAEDTAPQRHDSRANPGPKTEPVRRDASTVLPVGIRTKAENPLF
jgi:hypothetical protein